MIFPRFLKILNLFVGVMYLLTRHTAQEVEEVQNLLIVTSTVVLSMKKAEKFR